MTRDHEVLSFGELLTEEHGFISTVRKSAGSSNGGNEYVGLAMSGGGVRSAIFQVGVLQALATAHYLPQIDYISAVSGGGYACAWLVKWLKSSGDYSHVLESLASPFPRRQSERITWLRDTATTLLPALVLLQRTPSCLPPPTRITSYTT
jgi:predicted acylesterase/phospholipase RssA